MDCRTFRTTIERVDTSPHHLAELRTHAEECPECFDRHSDSLVDAFIRDTVTSAPLDTFALENRVRREVRLTRQSDSHHFWRWALAFSLALLLIVAWRTRPHQTTPTILSEAIEDHAEEVVQRSPLEWLTEPAKVSALVVTWTGDEDIPRKLAPPGYHLSRVRICELMNRTYLHLVYTDGSHEISAFVRKRDGEVLDGKTRLVRSTAIKFERAGDLQVAGFQSRGLTVLFVGDDQDRVIDASAVVENSLSGE